MATHPGCAILGHSVKACLRWLCFGRLGMETIQFEPMSVGRIFDRAFAIYRNNFLRFITIVAIIEVPLALFSVVSRSWLGVRTPGRQSTTFERTTDQPGAAVPARRYDPANPPPSIFFGCLGTVLTSLLSIVGVMLCQAALMKNVSETYLGHEITLGQAYGFILPKSVTLIAATICTTLVTWFGLMLCIVPGVIFGIWFFLTVPAIVAENRRALDGMSRSKALVAGNLGKAFAVGLVMVLIAWIVTIVLSFCAGFVGRMLIAESPALRSFLVYFASTVGQILVTPIGAAATILLYYDLRIRKEGFDLQMLAQSMASGQGEVSAT